MTVDWRTCLRDDGFALLPGIFAAAEVDAALRSWRGVSETRDGVLASKDGLAYGARNLLQTWPGVVDLLRVAPLLGCLQEILGPEAGAMRGLFFDKPPGHSWALPWHRDLTIAVHAPGPVGRFRNPTRKAGVPHVEAPADLLAQLLTVRIHLDAMTPDNGPLRVVPGSHLLTKEAAEAGEPVTLLCNAGDVLLMRPLVLHASGHCAEDYAGHRRILHLELAPARDFDSYYRWQDFVRLHEPQPNSSTAPA